MMGSQKRLWPIDGYRWAKGCRVQPVLVFDERGETFTPTGMPQFPKRLGFDLSNALTGHIKVLTNLFKRVVGVLTDSKAHP